MQIPVSLTERRIDLPDGARERIITKAEQLERYYDRITRCDIIVETPHNSKRSGVNYRVRIDMTVPGAELVVERDPDPDLNIAIRDAFDAARRRLEDFTRVQRRDVKVHEPEPMGRIARIFRNDGYGFIEDDDGRDIYFHRNSLVDLEFEKLKTGERVAFVEEDGFKGPQATTVKPTSRQSRRRTTVRR